MGYIITYGKKEPGLAVQELRLPRRLSTLKCAYTAIAMAACMILLFINVAAWAQTGSQRNDETLISGFPAGLNIQGDFRHFELDKLGNLFLISEQGSKITQYNKAGELVNHYDNVSSYGAISELDVTNPLKIAVYYRDYATIVVLDRFLSPVNTIDLRNAGIWEAETIASSYDNQFWVYDKQDAKIKKINGQGKVTFASNDLRQVFDDGVNPVKLLDRDGLLYAYDPSYGWYIFDYYGALNQKIPEKGLKDISVTEGILTGRKEKGGQAYLWMLNSDPRQLEAVPIEQQIFKDGSYGVDVPSGNSASAIQVRQTQYLGRSAEMLVLTNNGLGKIPLAVNK
ncbi:hypothetical protein SAMN05192529_107155 [Arachidicoccus rhizosphaerae]|jgi:hypothetical protein|uniref:6-bladed beta-propeller protein n=1 Tax=Arachidicoccus rhizosphaerae TaxID=551991 RepID=A0A1H3Y7T0_9BACT|nr:hypothetical protein [Arachidicoccus rhizosphaerae]SEA07706.1 hypothetical protein SAMN05192529_107155 [Arachidicoccus rhizosphaerae]